MKSLKLVLVAIFVLAALALTACSEGVTDVTDDGLTQVPGVLGNIYYWHNGQWELYTKGKVTVNLNKVGGQQLPYMTQEQVDGDYEFNLGEDDGWYWVTASTTNMSDTTLWFYYDDDTTGDITKHLYLE